jgi:signal transduction histidine kinase
MFEPFFSTKPAGTGLGLSIARAMANALGGDVHVETPPAGGARLILRVPRHPDGGP